MINCVFKGSNSGLAEVQGIDDRYVGFHADDKNGDFFRHFVYSKRDADKILGLKKGQKINVAGRYVLFEHIKEDGKVLEGYERRFFEVEEIQIVK